MENADQFLSVYHNLNGVLLKERKKSLYILLNNYKNADSSVIDGIISGLNSNTFLEEIYLIEVLIYFKRSKELFEILKNGNDIAACKCIKHEWFVNDILRNFSPQQLTDEVLPSLSESTRCKLLKKVLQFVKNCLFIDSLYDCIKERYGLKKAFILFCGCSIDKIKSIINSNPIKYSNNQLKLLYDKDPSLIEFYFKEYKERNGSIERYKWESFFMYIKTKNPKMFLELSEKYDFYSGKFGRQSTKKLLTTNLDDINKDPNKYIKMLKRDVLVRKLEKDFPVFYEKLFPAKMNELNYSNVRNVLKSYPKKLRYELYLKTFEKVYQKSLWENPDCMDESLIEFAPTKEEKEQWIEKYDKRSNFKKYLKKRKMCMARCMEEEDYVFLSAARPIQERKTIFNSVISTCKLTQDYDALLNILKFFLERHRNSEAGVFYNFLRTVYEEMKMEKLTKEHWDIIFEIINIQKFKRMQLYIPILLEYIKYLFYKQENIDECVLLLLQEMPDNLLKLKYGNDEFKKAVIEKYISCFSLVEDKENKLGPAIILCVAEWNKHHKSQFISINSEPKFIECVKSINIKEDVGDKTKMKAFKYFICNQTSENYVEEVEKTYWNNLKYYNDSAINKWFVKYKPQVFNNYLNKVAFLATEKSGKNVMHNIKKYENLSLPQKIVEYSSEMIKNTDSKNIEVHGKLLAFFHRRDDFVSMFESSIPVESKIDISLNDDEAKLLYDTRIALLKNSKFCSQHKNILLTLLKYCKGDYIRHVLPTLYSKISKISENELQPILHQLENLSVSVRKHSIYFTTRFLPVSLVLKKYDQVNVDEKNSSIKRYLFLNCYQYFLKNEFEECWKIIEANMENIKKNDKRLIKILTNVNKIPVKYRSQFAEKAWSILEKIADEGGKNYLSELVDFLDVADMQILNEEFCCNIIKKRLFDEYNLSNTILAFALKFMLYGQNIDKNVKFVFSVITDFKNKYWNTQNKNDALSTVHEICSEIFRCAVEKNNKLKFTNEFFESFESEWKILFKISEHFEEYVMIELMRFDKIADEKNYPKFISNICRSLSKYIELFGDLVVFSFSEVVKQYLRYQFGYYDKDSDVKYMTILNEILKENKSTPICLMITTLLNRPNQEEAEVLYKDLIEKLSKEDDIVKIYLWQQFKA